jgi:enoyl-CoA hydratase/carnithine racemase
MNETTPALPRLERRDAVFFLDLGDGENRLNGPWLDAVNAALDEVEAADGPRALITKASGKFWSNGLDLDWLGANATALPGFAAGMRQLYARLLSAPFATAAAVQGHAFAAGAVLALAHDHLVLREDRGYFCLPEIDLGIPFPEGVTELVAARMEPRVAHEALTSGRRYTGAEALAARIVDAVAPLDEVTPTALAYAGARAAANPQTLQTIKQRLYASTLRVLSAPVAV